MAGLHDGGWHGEGRADEEGNDGGGECGLHLCGLRFVLKIGFLVCEFFVVSVVRMRWKML